MKEDMVVMVRNSLARFRVLATVSLALLAAPVGAANIGISPILGDVPASKRIVVFEVRNHASEPVSVQVQAFEWHQLAGKETRQPAANLLIVPPIMTIEPGRSQLVRIALRDGDRSQERAYRVLFRELPSGNESGGRGLLLRTLLTLDVPLFFAPEGEARRELQWQLRRDRSGPMLIARNPGTRFVRLANVAIRNNAGKTLATIPGPIYVLAGAEEHLQVPEGVTASDDLSLAYELAGEEISIDLAAE